MVNFSAMILRFVEFVSCWICLQNAKKQVNSFKIYCFRKKKLDANGDNYE